MSLSFKSKRIEDEILDDLLNNGGKKYLELNNFIIEKFKLDKNQYGSWLEDVDLRVYEDICYDTVIDSWFNVQHLDSHIEVKEDNFTIIPPRWYEDGFINRKLVYPNTKEGLIEAFFDTEMSDKVCRFQMYGRDFFVCVDVL